MSQDTFNGFLNLHKPAGFTSHDCVAKLRRILRQKKIGHGGTLDPAAIGVLPVALGRATRLLQYLNHDKTYQATIRLGQRTRTDDLAGELLTTTPADHLTLEAVLAVLPQFQGQIQQVPPQFSAIQVDGKRLYDLARAGQEITVAARSVTVYRIEVLAWHPGEFPELEVMIACGAGTYIRAIARDLGQVLQVGGTLAHLTRTVCCGLSLADSWSFEQLAPAVESDRFQPLAPPSVLQHLPRLTLPPDLAKRWCQGQKIPIEVDPPTREIWQIYQPDDRFLGISQLRDGHLLVPQMVYDPISYSS